MDRVESLTKVMPQTTVRHMYMYMSCINRYYISLTQTFQDQGVSDYVVCYLRILTSGYKLSHHARQTLCIAIQYFQAALDHCLAAE